MATPTLLSVSNVALPNTADSGNVSVTAPTGANACVIGGTFYVGDNSVVTSLTGSQLTSTTNGALKTATPSGGNYMSSYAGAFQVTATGSQTIRLQKTGGYGEGPTCQIAWLTVDDPTDFVRTSGFLIDTQASSPDTLSVALASATTDLVLGIFGTDGSSSDPSAPSGTTQQGTLQTTQFDKSIVFSVDSPGASTTTITVGSRAYPTLIGISLKAGGGGGGASQSVAFTLADISTAFAQGLQHSQSLATSLDGVSVALAQKLQHAQALAITLDGVTVAIAQTAAHSQSLAATLDDVAVSIAQGQSRPQSLAITLDGIDVAINQTIGAGNSQAISFTLDGVTAAAAQTVSHPQILTATLDGVVVAVAQVARHSQSLAVTLDGVSASVVQGLRHSQALAATLDSISVQIEQSFSSPNKDQALAITLDDVAILINQVGPDNMSDTHDGFWVREWKKMVEREKKLSVEEVMEIVEEAPKEVLEAIPEVKKQVKKEFGRVDYQRIANNLQMQRFIAEQILVRHEIRMQELEEDDLEVLLLL